MKPSYFEPPYDSPEDDPMADIFIKAFNDATPDGLGGANADVAKRFHLSALAAGVAAVVKAMTAPAVSPSV